MRDYEFGNASVVGAGNGGWFVGHFLPSSSINYETAVEIKWGEHKASESFDYKSNSEGKSLVILIEGSIRIKLKAFGKEIPISLENAGDYLLWENIIPHKTEIVRDSKVLTVRWPSKRDSEWN